MLRIVNLNVLFATLKTKVKSIPSWFLKLCCIVHRHSFTHPRMKRKNGYIDDGFDNNKFIFQVLKLDNNYITTLDKAAFSSTGLVNLQKISIKNSHVTTIHKDAFIKLNILTEINLGNKIPDPFLRF